MKLRLPVVSVLAVLLVAVAGSGRGAESRSRPSAAVPAVAIAAGSGLSCALTRSGGVRCWGTNGHDELGDGTARDSWTPVDVSGLQSGVTAIAVGVRHACALTRSGGVRCWGNNESGSLGDGTTARRFVPVGVSGLAGGTAAIAAGFDDACALTSAGGVKCWGYNRFGALGDGTTADRWTPVDVSGLSSGVAAIDVGLSPQHGCALTRSGGVLCWGANGRGQLGDGTTADSLTPVAVSGLGSGVAAISAGGGHTCALTTGGGVECWGRNDSGQLGNGTTLDSSMPVTVSGLGGVAAIAASGWHSCALTNSGRVECWGRNDSGQLGNGTTVDSPTPVAVAGLGGVTAIATGSFHSCALTRTGGIRCWGGNTAGQLGDGTTIQRLTPVDVTGFGTARTTLTIAAAAATVTPSRLAAIRLRCGGQADCTGTLALGASVPGTLLGSSARRVHLNLGSRTFTIRAGSTRAVDVRLPTRAFRLLVRVKGLRAQARATFLQPDGSTTSLIRPITLTRRRRPATNA